MLRFMPFWLKTKNKQMMFGMKYYALILLCWLTALTAQAQERPKFSPEKFEADMEAFITREAKLTEQEAAKYFPLLREMHQKQRTIYTRMRKISTETGTDEQACAKAVRECDRLNIELREIEQRYHEKMLRVVPACKVYAAIAAESRFHRQMMRGWGKGPGGPGGPDGPGGPNGKPKDRRR
jgi:hypothetical protein